MAPSLDFSKTSSEACCGALGGATREGVQALVGRSHPGAKLLAVVAAAVLLFLSLASGAYRISAKTVVEGAVQRVAAVPFDGYILQSMVRAGDTVQNGDTLARLDDRELKLEQTRLLSEREQLLRRQREALATKDRAQVAELRGANRTGCRGFLAGG